MLRDFISANRAGIVALTRSKVATRTAPIATAEELENGIPAFLDQIIAALDDSPDSSAEAIMKSGAVHGGDLLRTGFTVAQVVRDYGGVCQAVTELATETNAPITSAEFRTFNQCLDDAIAGAVTEFTRQRDRAVTDERTERLGTLAHELRNALGSAIIAFDVLRSGTVGLGGSTAGVVDRSLKRLSTLIDSSLVEVRLDSGIRTSQRVSVHEFLEEVEVGAAIEANALDIALTVAPGEAGVDVAVDRQLLAGAVANLLHNAFKFTRPKSHVSVRASSTGHRVFIEVGDECGGLPPGEPEVLFQPFKPGGSAQAGLGLGLSIARRSVEANGGVLRVRDKPGSGCVFTIDLPRA